MALIKKFERKGELEKALICCDQLVHVKFKDRDHFSKIYDFLIKNSPHKTDLFINFLLNKYSDDLHLLRFFENHYMKEKNFEKALQLRLLRFKKCPLKSGLIEECVNSFLKLGNHNGGVKFVDNAFDKYSEEMDHIEIAMCYKLFQMDRKGKSV